MRVFLCCLLLSIIFACKNAAPNKSSLKLEQLADRSCRAIGIRQQRFALANKMRFAQDTLAVTKNKSDAARLQDSLKIYLEQKNSLLKSSLALADTIRLQLDSLMPYTDKQAQKRFSASLDSILAKKGCKGE